MLTAIDWPVSNRPPSLSENDVHVWAAALDVAPDVRYKLAKILADEERQRAERFKFDKHRNRFIAARGFMRVMLGRYLQSAPEQIEFAYSDRGKPMLSQGFADTLQFNLAHSGDLALLAISPNGPIGVDVECIRTIKDADGLVARFFSSRENALFQKLSDDQKPGAFFNLWTRKEALLKATGEGIAGPLSEVEVSFLPGEPARLLAIGGDPEKAAQWTLRELKPAAGFIGALAAPSRDIHLREWRFSDTPATS